MDPLRGMSLEFWPEFLAGVASTAAVALFLRSKLYLKKYWRRSRLRRSSHLWKPKPGADPKILVEEVFYRLRALDGELGRISSWRAEKSGDSLIFGLSCFLQTLAILLFFSNIPIFFAYINFLTITLLTSFLLALCRPGKGLIIVILFPLSLLLFATIRPTGVPDNRRAEILGQCRWHLLLAIPSTKSIREVLRRKHEHLAHVEFTRKTLAPMQSDETTGESIAVVVKALEAIGENIRSWPTDCSAFEVLDIPELSQVTETELEATKE